MEVRVPQGTLGYGSPGEYKTELCIFNSPKSLTIQTAIQTLAHFVAILPCHLGPVRFVPSRYQYDPSLVPWAGEDLDFRPCGQIYQKDSRLFVWELSKTNLNGSYCPLDGFRVHFTGLPPGVKRVILGDCGQVVAEITSCGSIISRLQATSQ